MPTVQKLCCVCGQDVASKKRVKDPRGQYYCEACYSAYTSKSAVGEKHAATGGVAVAAPPAPPADDMLDLAPVREFETPKEDMFGCSACKKLLPKRQIRNVDGEFICHACYAKRNQIQRGPASAKATSSSAGEAGAAFGDSVIGGLLFTFASMAAVFGIVFGLQFALALPLVAGEQVGTTLKDTSTAAGVGILYSFWNLGFAVVTWLGTLLAVKFGKGSGTLGSTLWKTFALCGGITIFFRITDQFFLGSVFGIIPCVFFALRYLALAVGLSAMFELTGIPRRAVAFVGMMFSELMGFLFYIALGILLGTSVIHADVRQVTPDSPNDTDEEEVAPQENQALQKVQQKVNQLAPRSNDAAPAPAAPAVNQPAASAPATPNAPAQPK